MTRSLPWCALLLGVALPVLRAQATLQATEVLRIHFTIASPPAPLPDVLQLHLGVVNVTAAHSTRTATLWDCDTLLGTAATSSFGGYVGALSLQPGNSWRQAGSIWNFDSPGDVPSFASIQNATIQGIIDFTIATGSIDLNLGNVRLSLVQANNGAGGFVASPSPVVTEAVIVPKLVGPVPGTVNAVNAWTTTGSAPGNLIGYAVGFSCSPFLVPVLPAVYFDLAPPLTTFFTFADPSGSSVMQFFVPPIGSGVTVLTQSVELIGPNIRVSNFVRHTFP